MTRLLIQAFTEEGLLYQCLGPTEQPALGFDI